MTMISCCSDLHIEFDYQALPGGEVLILAGDICEAKNYKKDFHSTKLLDANPGTYKYRDFFEIECAKYDQVFYVMGNHEHYRGRFDKTANELRSMLPANVTVLDKDYVEYNGVIYLGGTLWTNLNNADSLTIWTLKSMMNDYKSIQNYYPDKGLYHKLVPEYTFREHIKTLEYFKSVLEANPDKPVVVISHHGPTPLSIELCYKDDHHMNGGYVSDLSEFIFDHPNIKLWIAGHTHHTYRYYMGDTLVVSNPKGYKGYETLANNFQVRSIDLDNLPSKEMVESDYNWRLYAV